MIELNRVESIQLEISNHCNASCPQCPRNYYGGKTIPTLPLKKWSFQEFKDIIDFTDLDSLKQVYFCGTYGDPLSNSALVKMCSFIREVKPEVQIGIHTNGALSNEKTFRELATIADFIAFGIDGLEDTNHIYRRNVNWQKLMTNVNAFIGNGGMAIWDFIVFDHNQHQVEQAKELSEALGFAKFNIKRTGRFFNRKHEFEKKLTVYNRDGTVDYMIYPPEDKKYLNNDYFQIEKIKKTNGNLKNKKFWEEFAERETTVEFGIDGIDQVTHSRYRRGTSLQNILKNASTYIDSGGDAVWKMIKFDFNQDQIDQCRNLSKEMGFSDFIVVDHGRNSGPVFDSTGKLIDIIGNFSGSLDFQHYFTLHESGEMLLEDIDDKPCKTISCQSLNDKMIYISSDGHVYPCCFNIPLIILICGRLQLALGLNEDKQLTAKYFFISSFIPNIAFCLSVSLSKSLSKKELFSSKSNISKILLHIFSLSFLYFSDNLTRILEYII